MSGHGDRKVLVCRHLAEGAALRSVCHLKSKAHPWRCLCDCPEHGTEDFVELTWDQVSSRHPEIEELADMPENLMCRRGLQSGKWYDFALR